jgi:prolipoprotein diacylglyceryltransferase
MAIGIFALLWFLRKRIKTAGIITALYLILNGIERFLIESIRVNNKFDLFGINATQAQVIAVCFVIAGIGMYWYLTQKKKKSPIG